jgi:hypothetical protein
MTTLHLVRATLGLAALLLAAPAAQALSCTSTINFADGGADATDCAGQTVDIGFASGGRLTLRNVMSELWPQSSPISGMIISFNEDIDSFPGLAHDSFPGLAHEFRVRPLTSNQSWDQDLSVLDDMATFTASDASENLFLNDAYIWIVTVDFVNFVDSGSFELTYVPEPSTALLLGLGLVGLGVRRRATALA